MWGLTLDQWEKIASIASGFATAAGIILTLVLAPKQVGLWRNEKRETRRAEVAGEVLVSIIRFTSELKSVRSPFSYSNDDEEDEAGRGEPKTERQKRRRGAASFGKVLDERWQAFASTSNRFSDAWELAQVYLAPEVSELCARIWKTRSGIRAGQHTSLIMMRQGAEVNAEIWDRGFGTDLDKELDQLKAEAVNLLQPLARLTKRD